MALKVYLINLSYFIIYFVRLPSKVLICTIVSMITLHAMTKTSMQVGAIKKEKRKRKTGILILKMT
jgi:hypothetical protein